MKKSLIAIAAASTILTGCASTVGYEDLLNTNHYNYTQSADHSPAMNLMMKAYNIEPKNPNNLDEFTGDYHSRLARRSNVTGGAFTAMSLLGGASLGSSLFTGAIHSPNDQMSSYIRDHSLIRVQTIDSFNDLGNIVTKNRITVVNAMKSSLHEIGYNVSQYQHDMKLFVEGGDYGNYIDTVDFFVRNDLPQCDIIKQRLESGTLTLSDIRRDGDSFATCALMLHDAGTRIVHATNPETNEQESYLIWTARRTNNVTSAWHIEAYNALSIDDNTYLYSPSFYWLNSRNEWAEVDENTMDRAIETGIITPTPKLKVLDGTGTELPFSLDEEA
ncbi:hypothetical protein LRP52_29245 [Photobacterium sp. ZSDE20]|uniref:Lipoprotein n=1 Tax=Photobacterium pectinilyticum TaxID=2906793 RepID=A0ABT1NAE3_9GAMM|nr:hypothetical protein [Photobacterium sp. ZSDE20]MCQ1060279.1 hypothetical protein [Photobacterium sp. ZSDE20]MDD1826266.1 hypothetical protein [Photobacterium sp. ZSDE20]